MKSIAEFAEKLEKESVERLVRDGLTASIPNYKVSVKEGKKYTKVDIGGSGKYMVDEFGDIYGIKAYGVIHRGHYYGNLDTIDDYFWGGYTAVKK